MVADKTSEAAPESTFDAGCMAYLRQMAARATCFCNRASEPCMAPRADRDLCRTCREGCRIIRRIHPGEEDEVHHHAPPPRTEIEMTQRTDQVRAARKATVDRAVTYLTTADRDAVLDVLATTGFSDDLKADPDRLAQELRDADPTDTGPFFARWKAAQNVLLAAGLPIA